MAFNILICAQALLSLFSAKSKKDEAGTEEDGPLIGDDDDDDDTSDADEDEADAAREASNDELLAEVAKAVAGTYKVTVAQHDVARFATTKVKLPLL